MMYLTLSADYATCSLREEGRGSLSPPELGLSSALAERLGQWNERYQPVVIANLNDRQRGPLRMEIEELDRVGRALADDIRREVGDEAKIRYYSEGLLRYLD